MFRLGGWVSSKECHAPKIMAHCGVLKVRDRTDIDKRHAGCGVVVGNKLYLWGGKDPCD